jgi:hypothetical protein
MMEDLYHNDSVMAVPFINQGDIKDIVMVWYMPLSTLEYSSPSFAWWCALHSELTALVAIGFRRAVPGERQFGNQHFSEISCIGNLWEVETFVRC